MVRGTKMERGIGKIIHGDRTFDIVMNFLGAVIILIVLVPLIFVLAASFSDPDLVIKGKVLFWPKGFTTKAYTLVFENQDIWRGLRNTCFYTVTGTGISVILTILAAYPLSRKELAGRNFLPALPDRRAWRSVLRRMWQKPFLKTVFQQSSMSRPGWTVAGILPC